MITNAHNFLRSYEIDGCPIKNIILYNNGEKHEIVRGWLEHTPFVDGKPKMLSQDVKEIMFSEPVKAKKENLHRSDDYFIGNNTKGYTLYLKCHFVSLGEFVHYSSKNEVNYVSYLKCDLNVRLRDGQTLDYCNLMTGWRTEKTKSGIEMDRLAKELKAQGITITTDDLEKLLEKYTLNKRITAYD